MVGCCLSASVGCRPPERARKTRHQSASGTGAEPLSLPTCCEAESKKHNAKGFIRGKQKSILSMQPSRAPGDNASIKFKRSWLSRWKKAVSMSKRDKGFFKMQLSIWFPCVFTRPLCETVSEVKSSVIKSLGSISFVKWNEELSKSKHQRTRYRRGLMSHADLSQPSQAYTRLSSSSIKTGSESQNINICDAPFTEKVEGNSKLELVGYHHERGEDDTSKHSHRSRVRENTPKPRQTQMETIVNYMEYTDERNVMSLSAEEMCCICDASTALKKVPDWFLSFIESNPSLALERCDVNEFTQERFDTLPRCIKLRALVDHSYALENANYYVSVTEMVYKDSKPTTFARFQKTNDAKGGKATKHLHFTKNADGKPRKPVSDHSIVVHSTTSSEATGNLTMDLVRQKQLCGFQHSEQLPAKPQKRQKSVSRCKQNQYSQLAEKSKLSSNYGHILYSGDSFSSQMSPEHTSSTNERDVSIINTLPIAVTHKVKKLKTTTRNIDLSENRKHKILRNKPVKKRDVSITHLNTSNSSSNGINRTTKFSCDHFSGNPKAKSHHSKPPNTKESGKVDLRVKKDKPSSKSPKKKSGASSSSSPEARRSVFASYRNKYGETPTKTSETSEEDSRSLNSQEEKANYKALMEIALKGKQIKNIPVLRELCEIREKTPASRSAQSRDNESIKRCEKRMKGTHRVNETPVAQAREEKHIVPGCKAASKSHIKKENMTQETQKETDRPESEFYPAHEIFPFDSVARDVNESVASPKSPNPLISNDARPLTLVSPARSRTKRSKRERGSFLDPSNQEDFGMDSSVVTATEKNTTSVSPHSSVVAGEEICGDFIYESEKPFNLQHEKSKGLSPWSDTVTASVLKEPFTQTALCTNSHETYTVLPVQFATEGGDGPNKSTKRRETSLAVEKTPILTFSGDVTSNAGGDDEEEAEITNPTVAASGATIAKGEAENETTEKRLSDNESAAKSSHHENLGGQEDQNKETPCLDALAECMRKWGKPPCTRNYTFTPNLNPPCCISPCTKLLSSVMEKTSNENTKAEEKGGETPKEDRQAMQCNYTGFTDANKSELESLIDKHVLYLRCAQGEQATIPKQTGFITGATDPYSQMCKDLAFQSTAGLFNQTINKEKSSCPEFGGTSSSLCIDSCLKLPPLRQPTPCCPTPCLPRCYRDPCRKFPKICCTPPRCPDPCPPLSCCPKLPKICRPPSPLRDSCPDFTKANSCCPGPCPRPCSPPRCCTDPYTGRLKSCSPPPCCVDPCIRSPKPCDSRPCTDPCLNIRKPCTPHSFCTDPCSSLIKPCSSPPCCIDPCTSLPRPRGSRLCCIDPCTSTTKVCSSCVSCKDPCTGLPKSCSVRLSCIDPCSRLPESCSPLATCIDPCTGLSKLNSPRTKCIDPCTGVPKSCSPRPSCIDPCTGFPKTCSPGTSCLDPCTGLPKSYSPRARCVDPCTGLPRSCSPLARCMDQPKTCNPYPNFTKQYRIDPVTNLPILCSPRYCSDLCFEPCGKISNISCNSASDTKLSMFNSSLSFCNNLQCPVPSYRPRPSPLPCSRPCSSTLSFCQKFLGVDGSLGQKANMRSLSRRRSTSLDQFTSLQKRKTESQNIAQKIQCMESKWSGIKQKACEVMEQLANLQKESCLPKPQPCVSNYINPCFSPTCNPCPSPVCNPCISPSNNPCSPRNHPQPPSGNTMTVCCLCKGMPVCPEVTLGRNISFPCIPPPVCNPIPCLKPTTVCCACDKQIAMACRSACNQTSEQGKRPGRRCSTSCAQLNESSNKKFQVGGPTCAEISTCIGPSLMAPLPLRRKSRSEKKCTIMRIGKCEETKSQGGTTEVSCCSTQAEGGKITEIAKFVKECFDDSAVSTANRPIVKIRYNGQKGKSHNGQICQDRHLKDQIAKAIKKGKEIQKKNTELLKAEPNGPRSRTVLRFKAGKDSPDQCEIYNVKLEDDCKLIGHVKKNVGLKEEETVDEVNQVTKNIGKQQDERSAPHSKMFLGNDIKEEACYEENEYSSPSPEEIECLCDPINENQCHQDNEFLSSLEKAHLQDYLEPDPRVFNISSEKAPTEFTSGDPHITDYPQTKDNFSKAVQEHLGSGQHLCSETIMQARMSTNTCEHTGTNSPDRKALKIPESGNLCLLENQESIHRKQPSISGLCHQEPNSFLGNSNENANPEPLESAHKETLHSETISNNARSTSVCQPVYNSLLEKRHCPLEEMQTLNNFMALDILIGSDDECNNKASAYKPSNRPSKHVKSPIERQLHKDVASSKFDKENGDILSKETNNIELQFWSPQDRELRKRCLYLADPCWEAFEYIEANMSTLPTSYHSNLNHPMNHESKNLCSINSGPKNYLQKTRKSRHTICKKNCSDLFLKREDKSSNTFGKTDRFHNITPEHCKRGSNEQIFSSQLCTNQSGGELYMSVKNPTGVAKTPFQKRIFEICKHNQQVNISINTKDHFNQISNVRAESSLEQPKSDQDMTRNAVQRENTEIKNTISQAAGRCTVSPGHGLYSTHTPLILSTERTDQQLKVYKRCLAPSKYAQYSLESLKVDEQGSSIENDTKFYTLNTDDSEGSTQGIEDLPLDIEEPVHLNTSPCTQHASLSSEEIRLLGGMNHRSTKGNQNSFGFTKADDQKRCGTQVCGSSITSQNILLTPRFTGCKGGGSTATSYNKLLYAGDYVEVCSSAPCQDKILTSRYTQTPGKERGGTRHLYDMNARKVAKIKQQSKPLKMRVRMLRLDGDVSDTAKCEKITDASKVLDTNKLTEPDASKVLDTNTLIEADASKVFDTNKLIEPDASKVLDTGKLIEPDASKVLDTNKLIEPDASKVLDTNKFIEPDASEVLDTNKLIESDVSKVLDTNKLMEPNASKVSDTNKLIKPGTLPKKSILNSSPALKDIRKNLNSCTKLNHDTKSLDDQTIEALKNPSKDVYACQDGESLMSLHRPAVQASDITQGSKCMNLLHKTRPWEKQTTPFSFNRAPTFEVVSRNTSLFEMSEEGMIKTLMRPNGVVNIHTMNNGNTAHTPMVDHLDVTKQWINNPHRSTVLGSGILIPANIGTNPVFSDLKRKEKATFTTDISSSKNLLHAQTMTDECTQLQPVRDEMQQTAPGTVTTNKSVTAGESRTISRERISNQCGIEEHRGGGDSWHYVRVGCAQVTQQSPRRVLLQGAFVQHQSDTSRERHCGGKIHAVPFRLVFVRTSDDSERLKVKGLYSRQASESLTDKAETWVFNA